MARLFDIDVTAAKSKRVTEDDALVQESMRGDVRRVERRNPSTDEKKAKRRLRRKAAYQEEPVDLNAAFQRVAADDDWPIENQTGAEHDVDTWDDSFGSPPSTGDSRESSETRKAQLLEAMRFASLDEQRKLMADLEAIRASERAAVQAAREIHLADAIVADTLTPVFAHSRHTAETDWVGEIPVEFDTNEVSQEVVAEASLWFDRTSAEVKADRDEFVAQAKGMAARVAGQYGTQAVAAQDAFLRHVAFLNRANLRTAEIDDPVEGEAVTGADEVSSNDFPIIEENNDGSNSERNQETHASRTAENQSGQGVSGLPTEPNGPDKDKTFDDEFWQYEDAVERGSDEFPVVQQNNDGSNSDRNQEVHAILKQARALSEIAAEIRSDWGGNVNFAAKPYLDAMRSLNSMSDMYGADSAKNIVAYFLSNASSWRGETAKRVKAELKAMLSGKGAAVIAAPTKYDPSDPDAGLPKECVVCGDTPAKTYTNSEGRKAVLCFKHAQEQGFTSDGEHRESSRVIAEEADQSGQGVSKLPTPENNRDEMWPWELPDEDTEKGEDAANVADVPTPGGESGYPQPRRSSLVPTPLSPVQAAFRQRIQQAIADGETGQAGLILLIILILLLFGGIGVASDLLWLILIGVLIAIVLGGFGYRRHYW